jgi:hypothetical protein
MQNLNSCANIALHFITLLEFFHAQDYIADLHSFAHSYLR